MEFQGKGPIGQQPADNSPSAGVQSLPETEQDPWGPGQQMAYSSRREGQTDSCGGVGRE